MIAVMELSKAVARPMLRRATAPIILMTVALGASVVARADWDRPVSPPCEGDMTQPPYAPVGAPPNVTIWEGTRRSASPALSSCLDWPSAQSRKLVAVAATFQAADGSETLISRFGDVSSLKLVRYWSTTEQAWRPLLLAATAVTSKTGDQPRANFTSTELESGQDVYLSQRDGRVASDVIYRMRLRVHEPDRLVIETENVTPMRWFTLTLFKPGDLRATYFLEHRSAGTWSYYALTTIASGNWFAAGHDKSYINRVVAMYRYLAGIPTDLEPPPAR
jgi:hypothetical protein